MKRQRTIVFRSHCVVRCVLYVLLRALRYRHCVQVSTHAVRITAVVGCLQISPLSVMYKLFTGQPAVSNVWALYKSAYTVSVTYISIYRSPHCQYCTDYLQGQPIVSNAHYLFRGQPTVSDAHIYLQVSSLSVT